MVKQQLPTLMQLVQCATTEMSTNHNQEQVVTCYLHNNILRKYTLISSWTKTQKKTKPYLLTTLSEPLLNIDNYVIITLHALFS